MNDLATLAIDAHGGLDRWRQLKTVPARLLQGGVLWQLKGQGGVLDDVRLTVDLRTEWASHRPFGQPNRHSSFQPGRVAIEKNGGEIVEERANPRESFSGHKFDMPWDSLHLAYFAGYEVDIAGGAPAAHYVSGLTDVSGILVPTKHMIYPRQPDGNAASAPLVVSIDISDIEFK